MSERLDIEITDVDVWKDVHDTIRTIITRAYESAPLSYRFPRELAYGCVYGGTTGHIVYTTELERKQLVNVISTLSGVEVPLNNI